MSATTVAAETTSQQTQAERLFQPFELGPYHLGHRMVMAPLTRSRSRRFGDGELNPHPNCLVLAPKSETGWEGKIGDIYRP